MKKHLPRFIAFAFVLCAAAPFTCLGDEIPKTAWRRPLGQPLDHPGVRKNDVDIDDGYWQGAPVGGFGAGTFSRTYRGDFARWHIKAAVHKYETVFANQFAMFQKADCDGEGIARVLMNGHPPDAQLSRWQWDYPVGAGEYAALYRNPGTTTNGRNSPRMSFWNSFRRYSRTTIRNRATRLRCIAGTRKIRRIAR
jgi:non-lysosomal glucosylceramidase